jgi:predicted transcriptional regulator
MKRSGYWWFRLTQRGGFQSLTVRSGACDDVYSQVPMTERSKSSLAAEAIAAHVESEEWQLGEIQSAMADLDASQGIDHEEVSDWLHSWGKPKEKEAPQ